VHALAAEQPLLRIPGEEDDDPELDRLARGLVVEPVLFVRTGDVSRLADALRADDDVSQLEVDVRECAKQASVEARRALVAVPDMLGPDDLVDAVLGQRGEEPGQVSPLLGLRMLLPELANGVVVGGSTRRRSRSRTSLMSG